MSAGPDSLVDREGFFRRLNERESKKNENVAMVSMNSPFNTFLKTFLVAISTAVEKITFVESQLLRNRSRGLEFEDFERDETFGVAFNQLGVFRDSYHELYFFVGRSSWDQIKWLVNFAGDETVLLNLKKEFQEFQREDLFLFNSEAIFPLSKSNFFSATQKFKTFFQVMKDHNPYTFKSNSAFRDPRLKIYYPEADETVLPPLIGYTSRDYDEDLKELLRDPIMAQDVDPELASEIVEGFKREKRIRFPDEDIKEAMERAQKRQRTEEEMEAALLLLRNGGDMEAAAQMLAKIRFD
jgi:hypothetical protein